MLPELGKRRVTWGYLKGRQRAHNPKGAGSNPAPATIRDWLASEGVTQVAMEATGVYWKPVWHVLEDGDFELLLVNPAHFKNLPGGSFIPPADNAKLRDLTRYCSEIIGERVRSPGRTIR